MNKAVNGSGDEFYIVEVVGHDGIIHHLGPFRSRADAEAWMAQNMPQPSSEKIKPQSNDAYGPRPLLG